MASSFPAFCKLIGLNLEPFQKRIVSAAAGPERELLVCLPRGNGKTALLAAIALHHLLTTEGAQVYCAAASREQARILYEFAARFARELGHPNIIDRHLELRWCPDPRVPRVFDRHLRVLAADGPRLHGLGFSLAVADELHAHPSGAVYEALATALAKRKGAKLTTISSAGQGADTPLGRLRARALAQTSVTRRGACTDARGPNLRMLEWAIADDVEPTAAAAKKANPASWITVADLAAQREAVPELAWLRYHCGRWTERSGSWLKPGEWQAIVGEPEFAAGERIWIGVDVGGGGSEGDTAVCWISERLHVGVAVFDGEDGVLRARDQIEELAERFTIAEVVFDPWRASQVALELAERGMRTVKFPQTSERMIVASARLHRAVVERRLVVPADPILAQHASNAVAKQERRGWRLDRPGRAAGLNIDTLVALAMCVDRCEHRAGGVEVVGVW